MPERVWLITGASSGIGEETARAAVAQGDWVVLMARRAEELDRVAAELGDAALAVPGDVTVWADQERAVAQALERFNRLDVAFANAGVPVARGLRNESAARWERAIATNVLGTALTVRATLDALVQTRGHLLLTGAVSGRKPEAGSVFSATKAAVGALADSARQELAGTGVRVTVVEPGITDTPFYDNPQSDALRASDVARAVLWAVAQPARVDVSEILVRPVAQRYP